MKQRVYERRYYALNVILYTVPANKTNNSEQIKINKSTVFIQIVKPTKRTNFNASKRLHQLIYKEYNNNKPEKTQKQNQGMW